MGEETKNEQTTEQKPLDKMTVKELREVATEIPEITGASGMKKDELLAAIKKAKGIEEEKPAKKKKSKKKAGAGPQTAKDMKELIAKYRQEKEEVLKSGDRKKSKVLRRRINRLKKRSRRATAAV